MKRIIGFTIFLFYLNIALVIWAQDASSEEWLSSERGKDDAVVLQKVVVTASRVEEKKKGITSNVTIIDEEKIKMSSAKDLGSLLIEKGIGHTHKYPGGSTPIGIRGFRSEALGIDLDGYVIILLDGHRVATSNAAKILTKNIERVEIIRGPASVQYGSAAMGGVVNVITKQGKDKPTAFVEGMLGSFVYEEGSVGFSGKVNAFDFSGSFTTESLDDYDTGDVEKYYNTGYDEKEYYSLNLGFEFLPENRIGVIYTKFDEDHVGNPSYLSQNDFDDYKDSSNRSIDLTYDGRTPDGLFSWKARYFDGKDENKWVDPVASNPDTWDIGVPQKLTVDHKGIQAQVSYKPEYLLVTAGFDWMNYETENDAYSPKNTEYDNPAYFILAKARLLDQKFIISGGLRYDEYEVEIKKGEGKEESDNHISPRIGMAYLLTNYLKLRANYGEAFRMPSAQQLAADFTSWGTHYVGNPNLDPEKSETYEGGIDLSYAFFNSSFTYFHTDFKDKIEDNGGSPRTYLNIGKAEIEGVEGEFSCDVGTLFGWNFELKPHASFVYLTKYKDKETDQDLKYTSDLHVSYGITISDFDGLSADLNLAYTGKQKIEDWESELWPVPIVEKGGFTVANFVISKKILDYGNYGGITLRGEIQNLMDKDYAYVSGYPMPGRSFFLGLRYDY